MKKRIIPLLLVFALITGCTPKTEQDINSEVTTENVIETGEISSQAIAIKDAAVPTDEGNKYAISGVFKSYDDKSLSLTMETERGADINLNVSEKDIPDLKEGDNIIVHIDCDLDSITNESQVKVTDLKVLK